MCTCQQVSYYKHTSQPPRRGLRHTAGATLSQSYGLRTEGTKITPEFEPDALVKEKNLLLWR